MLPLGIINEKLSTVKNWGLEGGFIVKDFSFSNFKEAMDFVNKVAELSEEQNHHPDIVISYNKVRLSLTTHSEKGLTSKDFDLAREIDKLL